MPALQLLTLWMTRLWGGQWGMKDAFAVVWVERVHLEDLPRSEWEQRCVAYFRQCAAATYVGCSISDVQ